MNAEGYDAQQSTFLIALKWIQVDPEGLCQLRFEERVWPTGHVGICQLMRYLLDDMGLYQAWCTYAEEMFEAWPEYSGDREYPVTTFEGEEAQAGEQYLEAFVSGRPEAMWSPDHPYGAARRRLLDFLIEQFTQLQLEAR